MKFINKKGFTLIELLVVISLIGVLAVAVLSAINPIEQLNKGRDAGRRADAAQIIKAIDRYYASYEAYPWMDAGFTITPITSVTAAFLGTADMNGVGVCGAADGIPAQGDEITSGAGTSGCSWPGLLVNSEELKSQFSKRKAFRTINSIEDDLYIYKAEGDSSVSVCFIPSSKATKIKWDATVGQLKALAVSSTGFPTQLTSCSGAGTGQFAAEPTWTSAQTSCFVCVPEE